jgi:hypothetical protein
MSVALPHLIPGTGAGFRHQQGQPVSQCSRADRPAGIAELLPHCVDHVARDGSPFALHGTVRAVEVRSLRFHGLKQEDIVRRREVNTLFAIHGHRCLARRSDRLGHALGDAVLLVALLWRRL